MLLSPADTGLMVDWSLAPASSTFAMCAFSDEPGKYEHEQKQLNEKGR